jgi:hypothetical protein
MPRTSELAGTVVLPVQFDMLRALGPRRETKKGKGEGTVQAIYAEVIFSAKAIQHCLAQARPSI